MLSKSACVNLAAKVSHVNSLNCLVVIYLSWLDISFSISSIFVFKAVLVTNPLTSGILFSSSPIFVFKPV